MSNTEYVKCAHCHGRGSCSCDQCLRAAGLRLTIIRNPVICSACDGKGKQVVRKGNGFSGVPTNELGY